jgi:asparagine synthase (glutamine-hydrolysing)
MCGITGIISSAPSDDGRIRGSLKHRGPDQQGHYSDLILGKYVFFCHTRLSILDLSENGKQPMLTNDKKIVMIFNGEIYNFQELKKQFLSDESFNSRSDTEVILKLYEKKGIEFIHELNGDFAIAILDKRIGKMFLIRDRAGVKPLYYSAAGADFIFGSEIKAILASGIKPALNENEILNYFIFKYTPRSNTLYKNIFRVPPASYLEYDFATNTFDIKKYWQLKKTDEYLRISYSEAEHELHRLVKSSTEMRLISDVPVGNFLSGGLDSSIIASLVKDNKNIIHYCARKSESDLKKEGTTSDHYYASKLADKWKLNFKAVDIGKDEVSLDLIRKTIFYSDDLIADGSQIPAYLITQKAAAGSKVILSGMGADELFLGYAGHLLTLLSNKWTDHLPLGIKNMFYKKLASVNQGKGKFLAYRRYLHKMGKYGNYPSYKYGILNLVGDFENSCLVYSGDRSRSIDLLNSYFSNTGNVFDSLLHFETENVLVKNLHYMDRMAMANSVECRVPFLDHRLMEFAYNIPTHFKLSSAGRSKRLLKDAFSSQLPGYILRRRKAGFGMPLRSIFASMAAVDSLLDRAFFSNFKNFSMQNIELIIQNHISGKEDNSSIIYALISFQEWYKMNFTS